MGAGITLSKFKLLFSVKMEDLAGLANILTNKNNLIKHEKNNKN
jgi:hypothetical protein